MPSVFCSAVSMPGRGLMKMGKAYPAVSQKVHISGDGMIGAHGPRVGSHSALVPPLRPIFPFRGYGRRAADVLHLDSSISRRSARRCRIQDLPRHWESSRIVRRKRRFSRIWGPLTAGFWRRPDPPGVAGTRIFRVTGNLLESFAGSGDSVASGAYDPQVSGDGHTVGLTRNGNGELLGVNPTVWPSP